MITGSGQVLGHSRAQIALPGILGGKIPVVEDDSKVKGLESSEGFFSQVFCF